MEVKIIEENDKVVVKLDGEVDLYNSPELRDALTELMDKNKINILMDLNGVEYIDSSGIGVLIASTIDIKEMGGTLSVKSLSPNVKRVFELTRLMDFFNIEEED